MSQTSETQIEQRHPNDTPLTEQDLAAFDKFFSKFLNKRPDDSMSFLKSLALFRRGDLREAVSAIALLEGMYNSMLPNVKQRDLLLSFPSVITNLHKMVFGFNQSYGGLEGQTVQGFARDQVMGHLDGTEMFRLDLDKALEDFPSILEDDHKLLSDYIAEGLSGQRVERTYRFIVSILADHPFLVLIPATERNSTQAIGRLRKTVEQRLGEKFDEFIIEFFTVGGGFLRWAGDHLHIGGGNPLFDPYFASPESETVTAFKVKFSEHKFMLARRIIGTDFPNIKIEAN
jgi:hypothetical protein